MDYDLARIIDAFSVIGSAIALCRLGAPTLAHPGVLYLLFHVYTVSWRLAALAGGAPPLFGHEWWPAWADPVTEAEIVRAVLIADLALITMCMSWLAASRGPVPTRAGSPWGKSIMDGLVVAVSWVAIPVGVTGLILFARMPGVSRTGTLVDLGSWSASSYPLIIQAWAGLALVALVYCFGFKRWLLVPLGAYLAVMAIQGYHRYRVIIPILLLALIYLDQRAMRWPSKSVAAILVAGALIFFPLKTIGNLVATGASMEEIAKTAWDKIGEAATGDAPDQWFLDEFAASLTLVDERDKVYWGSPYAAMLVMPVPRQWWPGKPSIGDYVHDFSRTGRPMGSTGMIVTYLGEAYANFRYFGVVLIPFALGYFLTRAYRASNGYGHGSVGRFAYLLIACNLVQVYRDGLVSLLVFTAVNMLPLTLILLLQLLPRFSERHLARELARAHER